MNRIEAEAALTAKEKLGAGCATMKELLAGLLDSKGRVAEEVHAIRKLGKSLRGGFTLFRLEKSAALEIQAIGRLLSGPRDAVSRQNTWNKLGWNEDAKLASAVAGLLEIHVHSAARRPPAETIDWCVERVDQALAELNALDPGQLPERITGGLEKLARRVKKRCRRMDHRSEEDFHEARKSLKAWLGAVGFLPDGLLAGDPLLHEMAEFLGDENDLATLSAWLDEHGFSDRFAPDLWRRIKGARRKLQKRAIKDAERLVQRGGIDMSPPATVPAAAPEAGC